MSDTMKLDDGGEVESLDAFRARARAYISENIPRIDPSAEPAESDEEILADIAHQRELQRLMSEGGLAGIIVPTEYGGQGLTPAHSEVLNEEMVGYQFASRLQVPGMTPCMTVLLEFASEELKKQHVPAILDGSEIWMQMLSEPSGGSDAAGAQTTAVRDGDEWILNGSKIWTSGAWFSDWALILCRTNQDVPKHRGLTVFVVPFDIEGLEMQRIELLDGERHFCQEFLTDVRIPDAWRISDVDDGWTVGTRWMYYERSYASSPYVLRPGGSMFGGGRGGASGPFDLASKAGRLGDGRTRELVGEAVALSRANDLMAGRVKAAMATGHLNNQAASLLKLSSAYTAIRSNSIRHEIAGPGAVAWTDEREAVGAAGLAYLSRQSGAIAGGTIEMARNVVSERVLGMPRERTMDRDIPFREIPKGPSK